MHILTSLRQTVTSATLMLTFCVYTLKNMGRPGYEAKLILSVYRLKSVVIEMMKGSLS